MSTLNHKPIKQQGTTLIELVVVIVVVSIAAVALFQGLGGQFVANVDPMLRSQSQLIARQMLEEVQHANFFDPDFDPRIVSGLTEAQIYNNGIFPPAESSTNYDRNSWDNVNDYHKYNSDFDDSRPTGIKQRNQSGTLIDGLEAYRVEVSINGSPGITMGSGAFQLSNTPGCLPRFLRIEVTVTDPAGQITILNGYKSSFYDPVNADATC